MTVYYKKRLACGVYNDVQVVEVKFDGSGCAALNAWLADPNVSAFYKGPFLQQVQNVAGVAVMSYDFTLKWNTSDEQQQEAMKCPNGTSLWRVTRGSCWYVHRWACEQAILVSCPNSACCLQNFTLCMGSNGVKVEFDSIQAPSNPCAPPVDPGSCAIFALDGNCYFLCDNDGLEDIIPYGIKKEENPEISKQDGDTEQDETEGNTEAHIIHH